MADPVFQRPLELPAPVAVERAVKWLTHHGYQLSAQSDLEASLVYPGGGAPLPPRHGLKITADGRSLIATHLRASIFDAPPSAVELAWFERLVDQLIAALGSFGVDPRPARPSTPAFCPECGTRAEAGALVCAICGAKF